MPTAPSSGLEEVGARATIPQTATGLGWGAQGGRPDEERRHVQGPVGERDTPQGKGPSIKQARLRVGGSCGYAGQAAWACSHRLRSGRLHRAGEKWVEGIEVERLRRRDDQRTGEIWNNQVGAPKSEAREAGVYVVPLLREVLAKYKASYRSVGEGW